MIKRGTYIDIICNSGAKKGMCIDILGGTKKSFASLGDLIVVAVKEASPKSNIKKGSVVHSVVVQTKKESGRKDGSYIRFNLNAVVLVNKERQMLGTRVYGAVARQELRENFPKIISSAQEAL